MVFESLVVDLVNRYLGDFVENLDPSQLKIGIWGGDVVLNNLYIKESALNDLDLPVKVLHGNLGKLTLKIPWKNLYSAPTVATLEGLYVVAVPNMGVKYNEEREKKAAFEGKQKELRRIDEMKRIEAEKNKPKEAKADSFAEKMATNIIKNLQVNISDIHVRYEDRFTNPARPVSIGVTLKELSFQTTDDNWKPAIIKEAVTMINKLVKLDSLSMYWNSKSASYVGYDKEQMLNVMKGSIAGMGRTADYQYLIEPISSGAQLVLNTKPDKDNYSIPKMLLNVIFEQIALTLNKNQYQDVLEMLESFERVNLAGKYRKFRPDVDRKGHAKEWWHFAYHSILEETVRRRRNMWSWEHIRAHRQMCHAYKTAYKTKLTSKKVGKDVQAVLDKAEQELTVFNLTLVRQQAEMESKKEGKAKEGKGGWFGGWWGGGAKKEQQDQKSIGEQFQTIMSPEEKAKLYDAIGYQEDQADPTLPKEFIANKVNFKLKNLSLTLRDPELRQPNIMNLRLQDLAARLGQRPAANAIKVEALVDSLVVLGMAPQAGGGRPPVMVSSQVQEQAKKHSLIDATFETNPLDGACDTRVNLSTWPLEIVYDALTINEIAEFFKPPESVHLKQLQAAAMTKLVELKEQTATGLQHAIEQRKYTEITVNVRPTYVLIPERGSYTKDAKLLVVDLGQLSVSTEKQDKTPLPSTAELDFSEVMKKAYDKFKISLKSVQVLYVSPGQDWKAACNQDNSSMHILRPMAVNVDLSKCMIQDMKIPKMKVNGELPSLHLALSDQRLQEILGLVQSIPFPKGSPAPPEEEQELEGPDIEHMMASEGNTSRLVRAFAVDEDSPDKEAQSAAAHEASQRSLQRQASEFVNQTDLELTFEIKEICVTVAQRRQTQDVPLLKVVLQNIGTEVKMRSFDMSVSAYLGAVYVQHVQFKVPADVEVLFNAGSRADSQALSGGPLVDLINTPITDETAYKLLTIHLLKANKKGPEFATLYKNTEQKIDIHFSTLEVVLHQEAILSLISFAKDLQTSMEPAKPAQPAVISPQLAPPTQATPHSATGKTDKPTEQKPARKRSSKVATEVIDLALEAKMDVFSVVVCTQAQSITKVDIRGLTASVSLQKSKTSISASLTDISVFDPTVNAIYPKILSFEGGEVFSADVVVYNGATDGDNYCNMAMVDTKISLNTGCMKVVFLMKFVNSLLAFLDQFQAAKDKMAEASSAAVESAAHAAKDFSQKAARVSLNIKMKAPVIIVPQKSTSNNALVVDLGRLSISNSFQVVGQKNAQGIPGVLDNMVIQLTALKLSRALMLGSTMQAECLLLDPVTLRLEMSRNLAASWYHGHPDLQMSGKLENFSVGLSQGDFTTIMSVLSGNMQETAPPPKRPATDTITPVQQAGVSADPSSSRGKGPPAHTAASQHPPKPATQAPQVWSKVKVSFTIENIKLELYNGDSSLTTGFSQRDKAASLSRMEFQLIGLTANVQSDTAVEAHIILHACILDDSRPGKENGITRMVDHSKEVEMLPEQFNMIDVTFVQDSKQKKDAKVAVNGLYICVCPEYLMTVAAFFTEGMPKDVVPAPVQPPPAAVAADRTEAEIQPKTASPTASSPPGEKAAADTGELSIMLTIDRPEIVLVENPMNIDTNALILDLQVKFKMTVSPELQMMQGEVAGLQIVSCIFSPEKRDSSKSLILAPINVSLHSNAPQGKGAHMAVMVSDVILNISPASIRTIAATLSAMPAKKEEEEKGALASIPKNLWGVKKLEDCSFWFLQTGKVLEQAQAADARTYEQELAAALEATEPRGEQLLLNVSKVLIKMEGGVGKRTVPFIITEMTFNAEVKDWSGELFVSARLELEVAYYNEALAVWEPIIEPVEDEGVHRPWELSAEISKNDLISDEDLAEGELPGIPPPAMSIKVYSQDILQATITKNCLQVLQNLGKSFGDAYALVEVAEKPGEVLAPFLVNNDSGMNISLKLDDSFKPPAKSRNGQLQLYPGESMELYNAEQKDNKHSKKQMSVIKNTQQEDSRTMYIVMEEFGATRELRVARAEKRAFGINQRSYPGDTWHLIGQTDTSYGCKTITLRSMVQVKNHLPFAVEVYYKLSDDAMGRCGEVESDASFNVPLDAVYAAPYELYFKPRDAKYKESGQAFRWKEAAAEPLGAITCEPVKQAPELKPIHFNVKVDMEDVLFEHTGETTAKCYTCHLHPGFVFRNLLPSPVTYSLEGKTDRLDGGHMCELLNAKVGESTLEIQMSYQGKEWTGSRTIEAKPDELAVWSFEAVGSSGKDTMDLGVHCSQVKGYQEMELYCPYWMINKTGRSLTYKATDDYTVTHTVDHQGAVLFSFKGKSFFAKKKASLKISESEWSDKFSLDTVGSAGTVACKLKGYNFEVGVNIVLASSGLTKIITFTPYYKLINQAQFAISIKENVAEGTWYDVLPNECIPFWPTQTSKKLQMVAKVKDSDLETKPFYFNEAHTTLMRLDSEYGGLCIECQVMESAINVVVQQYKEGHAAVLLVNSTASATLQYAQREVKDESMLEIGPGETVLYTWQDALIQKELTWTCGEKVNEKNSFIKDGMKDFFYNSDTKLFWVSFLDGMQRIFLLTDDLEKAMKAQQAGELERLDQEVEVSLQGMGLSLVNNDIRREVAYLGITSSGAIWEEEKKKKRHKALKGKHSALLEEAYIQYQMELATSGGQAVPSRKQLNTKLDIDFATMQMFKPNKCNIRRSYRYGIWLSYGSSPHQLQFHVKLHRLQLDNQISGSVFPTVLAPIPPPKSVAAESVPKPFAEVSVMIRKRDYTNVMQFKYAKVLVQEMAVKVDQGFLNALIMLFSLGEVDHEQQLAAFQADITLMDKDLLEEAVQSSQQGQKHFYDNLHVSPLKIHLSFSLYGSDGSEGNVKVQQPQSNVLGLFLQSIGIVLTDIQDVIFKLGYFERQSSFYSSSQLNGEIARHYSSQAIKQMYVLVLGLDVLGNPFGVIRGIAEGIEDLFYEPYQGAIQGPEEFAEGLALGVRSLLGHAVGGAAGAVSRITGVLGKGIASLTMDEEYQRKRREQLNKRPADFKEGLARGGKGLVMGVVGGVTGIVMKPVEGARQDGVEGFFKGMGKGLVGAFTRPASGVVDFASTSLDGIRRVAELSDEVRRLRPPRYFQSDGVVRPYTYRDAEGDEILAETEKGKFAKSDSYLAHVIVTPKDMKNVLLVTDKRVIFVVKGEIFGQWNCDWQYEWEALKEAPTLNTKGVQILLKEKQKKSFFSSGTVGKLVPLQNKKSAEWIVGKMKVAMAVSKQ